MASIIGAYDYSVSREHLNLTSHAALYLDYNEYHGSIHDRTLKALNAASSLLTRYHRPGKDETSPLMNKVFSEHYEFSLVSGADQGLEEILGYCHHELGLQSFHSLFETTYDHFYTFAGKHSLKNVSLKEASLVYVCCPNNPDGSILSPRECADLVNTYPGKHFIFDLSYLAYSEFAYRDYLDVLRDLPNLYFVSSLAKMYPLAGLRGGWVATTSEKAREHFQAFVNAKMVNPMARVVLLSCLKEHHFYQQQTEQIRENRRLLANTLLDFFNAKDIQGHLQFDLEKSAGNFFSLQLLNEQHKFLAVHELASRNIFVRTKSHWNFLRVTSVNDQTLEELAGRLS